MIYFENLIYLNMNRSQVCTFLLLMFGIGLMVPTALFAVRVGMDVYGSEPIWIWFLFNTIFIGLLLVTIALSIIVFANLSDESISWKCFNIIYLVFLILSIALVISGSILYSKGEFTYENEDDDSIYYVSHADEKDRNSIRYYSKSSFVLTIIIAIILMIYIITGFI